MSRTAHTAQRGFSLIVVLLMLTIAMVLGIGAAQVSLVGERSARNDRDTEIAFQAAEAALIDAERDVLGPNASTAQRLCLFNGKDVSAFVPGCGGTGIRQGLCAQGEPGAKPVWMSADFAAESATSVAYGTFTGQTYAAGNAATGVRAGTLPARAPRYIVEAVRNLGGWQSSQLQSASVRNASHLFRVTAIGYGMREETQVVLQTSLYKSAASPGCPS
ncbi:type IV pilus assembly protein PilX [Variovorax paradoxus]|jgi:type IV pilus assembly protein PilX|uniref:pilus assembly PilX family protein n=1 Tax=Variovorax paradoxus TaxID=34073 RepID=UPI00339A74D3